MDKNPADRRGFLLPDVTSYSNTLTLMNNRKIVTETYTGNKCHT